MEQLEIHAKRFRDAIERTPAQQLPIAMQGFPTGACGDAALLLGHYLKAQGFGTFHYVLGKREEHSHAWLQQGEIIIDITADQFPEVDHAVIVTATPTWHDGFASEVLHEADFTIYDPHTVASLGAAYHTVMQHMETSA